MTTDPILFERLNDAGAITQSKPLDAIRASGDPASGQVVWQLLRGEAGLRPDPDLCRITWQGIPFAVTEVVRIACGAKWALYCSRKGS